MALTDIYTLPTGLTFTAQPASNASGWIESSTITVFSNGKNSLAGVNATSSAIYFSFYSPYKTFHIQSRYRRRYKPSNAVYDSSAETEIWTDWTSWFGSESTSATVIKNGTRISYGTVYTPYYILASNVDFDLYQREYRVRVYNEPDGAYSDWVSKVFTIVSRPEYSLSDVIFQPDSTVTMTVTTPLWQREAYFILGSVYSVSPATTGATSISETYERFPLVASTSGSSASITLPVGIIPAAATTYYTPQATIWLPIGCGSYRNNSKTISATGSSASVTSPTVTFTDATAKTTVTAVHSSATSIKGTANWTDVFGVAHTLDLGAFAKSGTTFTASMEAPPPDVTVTFNLFVVTSSGWKRFAFTHAIPSSSLYTFTHGTETVTLKWRADLPEMDTEGDVETVQLASGRRVSRYGNGRARTWRISASIINPSIADGGWMETAEKLGARHDWTFTSPKGERAEVTVSRVTVADTVRDAEATVELDLVEVG